MTRTRALSRPRFAALLLPLLLALSAAPRAEEPMIQGVYDLRLGMSPEQAEAAMEEDERFQRIAGRHFQGFPLYQTALGEHRLRVHPTFSDDHLVSIALRFRETVSPNDVNPVIRDQLRFAAGALSARFGEPDRVPIPAQGLDGGDFRRGASLVSHAWQRGERHARIMLWREGFEHGVDIVLAEHREQGTGEGAAGAF